MYARYTRNDYFSPPLFCCACRIATRVPRLSVHTPNDESNENDSKIGKIGSHLVRPL